jgi:hypothetical protein
MKSTQTVCRLKRNREIASSACRCTVHDPCLGSTRVRDKYMGVQKRQCFLRRCTKPLSVAPHLCNARQKLVQPTATPGGIKAPFTYVLNFSCGVIM